MDRINSFDPVVGPNAKILILGTMPGNKSLEIKEYYGYNRNQFWRLMSDIFNFEISISYEDRLSKLLDNNIALWDVIDSCVRNGSLDKDIHNIKGNDIGSFLKQHPTIDMVVFNGKKACDIYKKYIGAEMDHIKFVTCYSTSPANAIKYDKKLEQWALLREAITG